MTLLILSWKRENIITPPMKSLYPTEKEPLACLLTSHLWYSIIYFFLIHKDVTELKTIKSQNEILNICSNPFLILFEENFKAKGIDPRNTKTSSWSKLLKFIMSTDFYKLLSEFQVETVAPKKIRMIESYLHEKLPSLDEVARFSTSLFKLISWLHGN